MATKTTANIRQTLTRRCAKLGIPIAGTFELTARCNLQCRMCYIRLTPEQVAAAGQELTAAEWLELARAAKDSGMVFLLLTGGEPTLRSDFCEIYEELAQMGFSITINTNGTMLNPRIRELWHRFPPAQVNVTLYGASQADYDALCCSPSAFDRVVENLHWLKEEGILTHLNTTMTPANRNCWIAIEEFAREIGLELRMTTYCFPPVRREACGSCSDFARLTPEEAADLAVRDMLYQQGPEAVRKRAASTDTSQSSTCTLDEAAPVQCSAGKSQFWVTWDGRMTPCGMLNAPALPIGKDFHQSWQSLRQKTDKIRLCPECAQCSLRMTCQNCAAVTYAETGHFSGKPEYMCQYNIAYRAALEKVLASL